MSSALVVEAAPLGDILAAALSACAGSVDISAGAVYLTGPRGEPVLEVHADLGEPAAAGSEQLFGCPELLAEVVASGRVVVAPSPDTPVCFADALRRLGLSSALVVPVAARGERIGALFLGARHPRMADPERVVLARAVAGQIGLSVALTRTFANVLESEQRQRMLIDGVLDHALFMLDAQGRVASWNAGAERIFGHPAPDVVGRDGSVFFTPEDVASGRPQAELAHAVAHGRFEGEGPRVRADGSRFWAHTTLTALRGPSGELRGFARMTRDVTSQREVDARLRMLESVVRQANDAVVVTQAGPIDEPGPVIEYVNDAFVRTTGYSRDEVLGRSPRFLQGPGTDRAVRRRIRKALEQREPIRTELLNYRKDGSPFWVEVALAPVFDARGEVLHWVSVQRDSTQRREAEKAALRLAREEAARAEAESARRRLEEILESITDGFVAFDRAWRFTYVNARAEALLAKTREELLGAPLADAFPEIAARVPEGALERGMDARAPIELEAESPTAARTVFHIVTYPSEAGLSVYFRDITARRKIEEERRRLSAIVENTPDFVGTADAFGRITYLNGTGRRLFGLPEGEDVSRLRISDFHPPADAERILREGLSAAVRDGVWAAETSLATRGAGEVPVSQVVLVHRDPRGEVEAFSTVMRDITERKRAESAQRFLADASKALASGLDYEEAARNLPALAVPYLADICVVDLVERERRRRFAAARDPSKQDLLLRLCSEPVAAGKPPRGSAPAEAGSPVVVPEITRPWLWEHARSPEELHLMRALDPSSAMIVPFGGRRGTAGTMSFWAAESGRRYGPFDLALAVELADRAALGLENARLYGEEQRAVRLRDEVLAVVSHDLRAPVALVDLHASVMLRSLGKAGAEEKVRDGVQKIRRATDRMTKLIAQLLDLGRIEAGRLTLDRERLDARGLVGDAVDQLRPISEERGIRLTARLPDEELTVLAERDRIAQVLSNLIGNALDFTPRDGSVTVRVERGSAEACFSVADTGPGIAAEHLTYIFDRYRQAPGGGPKRGCGLGLHIVRGLVEAHGGRVWVESEVGSGSTFFFTIPAA